MYLLVQAPVSDLRSDMGKTSYGWRHVRILDDGPDIGRAKKIGGKSYKSWKYRFYSMSSHQMVLTEGRSVLQFHQEINLIDTGPI